MLASELLRTARKRAGLSQAELAARAGTTQSAIARLESGTSSPRFEHVADLVAACGLELRAAIAEPMGGEGGRPPPPVVPPVLGAILEHGVRVIATAWFAAALRGVLPGPPRPSVCPDESLPNLASLCRTLDDVAARRRTPEGTGTLPFDRTPADLIARGTWRVATTAGEIDVALQPPGTGGYRDLLREATPVAASGIEVPTASVPDVIRELEASGADPDTVHVLRRSLRRDR